MLTYVQASHDQGVAPEGFETDATCRHRIARSCHYCGNRVRQSGNNVPTKLVTQFGVIFISIVGRVRLGLVVQHIKYSCQFLRCGEWVLHGDPYRKEVLVVVIQM